MNALTDERAQADFHWQLPQLDEREGDVGRQGTVTVAKKIKPPNKIHTNAIIVVVLNGRFRLRRATAALSERLKSGQYGCVACSQIRALDRTALHASRQKRIVGWSLLLRPLAQPLPIRRRFSGNCGGAGDGVDDGSTTTQRRWALPQTRAACGAVMPNGRLPHY